MGITIHYKGRIANPTVRQHLIAEITDICQSMEWKYTRIDPQASNTADASPLHGVVFYPHPHCEPVSFVFDKAGWLRSMAALQAYISDDASQRTVSVKTQFSSPDIHIAIVKILRYIQYKFLPDLDVTDEGDYWETEDRRWLQHKFEIMEKELDALTQQLQAKGEELHRAALTGQLIERLEKLLREYLGDTVHASQVVFRSGSSKKSNGIDFDEIDLN